MPDGAIGGDASQVRGFERLTPAGVAAFRDQARGELRRRLDMIELDFAQGDDGWLYRRAGVVRGIGALSQFMPWHWMLWSFPGDLNLGDWKRIIRFTRLRVQRKLGESRVTRISATARCDVRGAAELLEVLDFRIEGVMHCYGPGGEAHYLYAITRAPEAGNG